MVAGDVQVHQRWIVVEVGREVGRRKVGGGEVEGMDLGRELYFRGQGDVGDVQGVCFVFFEVVMAQFGG